MCQSLSAENDFSMPDVLFSVFKKRLMCFFFSSSYLKVCFVFFKLEFRHRIALDKIDRISCTQDESGWSVLVIRLATISDKTETLKIPCFAEVQSLVDMYYFLKRSTSKV